MLGTTAEILTLTEVMHTEYVKLRKGRATCCLVLTEVGISLGKSQHYGKA